MTDTALRAVNGETMPKQRDNSFEEIRRDGAFDVVVVGGGINGIGVFRDLALQDLRVLLVERNDFCSGCSAAPSRMIHGGGSATRGAKRLARPSTCNNGG